MKTQLFAGKFEIQGEIAKGQTGTIYYGYDLELRQEVAIKIYHSHINGRLIRGKAFIEKSKPLLRLKHPNLLEIFKIEENDETPVIYMEFFDAPSLQHVIHTEGPLPVEKMLLLAREITEALVHTHFQGVIHGTLHPGHILVGPQGRIKVIDLGLSSILMDILPNCDVGLLEPLPYLLPEIAKGELLNVSSDLYGLGFMMYDMLTRRVPYSGLPKTSVMGKLAFDQADPDFDFPDSVPDAIRELIRQMTRNKSQDRLQDATHVLTILNQQLAKIAPDDSSLSKADSGSRLPKESTKTIIESSAPQPPVQVPDPTPNQSVDVNCSKHSADNPEIPQAKFKKQIGLTLGIILLLAGVIMSYWYSKLPEIPVPSKSQERPHPTRPLIRESVPPIDSSATIQTQIPISSFQNTSSPQEQTLKTDNLPNIGTSTPAQENHNRIEAPGLRRHELKNEGAPSRSSQKNTELPISAPHPDPETNPVSEQPNASRPQDNSSMTHQPFTKKNLSPVTQPEPAPKTSSAISETGLEASPIITNEPVSHLKIPSAPVTDTTRGIQESPPASHKSEPIENMESKELKEVLDDVDATETMTILPAGPQIPSSPPSTPSTLSLPESSQ
jgi:serine/threonine protein kinase